MEGTSKKRMHLHPNMTISEENAKNKKDAKDELEIAKGNRIELRNEAEKRKRSYTALQSEIEEYKNVTGEEPTNIAIQRDDAKKGLDEIQTDLNDTEEKYSKAVENYKKARENNGADNVDAEVKQEGLQDDIDIAEGNITILREYLAETKMVYGNTVAKYKADETPELDAEVKIQKKRFNITKKEIEKVKKEIKELKKQQNNGESPAVSDDEDADENLSDDGLFVRDSGHASDASDASNEGDEDVDPEDLWSPALARKRAGLRKDVFRIEGYRDGRPAKVITGRGPPNASSFRLENESDYAVDRKTDIDITKNRLGDEKIEGKWQYGKNQLPVIQGVALPPDNSVKSVKPIPKVPYGQFQQRATPTAVRIKWWLGNNNYVKCWETRSTIRRIWGRVQGDIAIYEAAIFQEKRYEQWQTGHRGDTGRSPSAQPSSSKVHFDISDDDSDGDNGDKPQTVGKTKKKQGEPKVKKEPGEEEPPKAAQNLAETTQKSDMKIFEARWCERRKISPADMTDEQDLEFFSAWQKVERAKEA
ncbi:hypothetical protein V493_01826 [Pseudogymnoascus sp. VKM F-4281 (FW-2241)]|nr:hypothetical protein V493_01826 [Pseudogymnoascus sp. VKM F-4281 (FW-2241)]